MIRGAQSQDLKTAFETHLQETEGQIERLVQVFEILGKPARGKTCPAIDGIVEEGQEILEEFKDSAALDAGLLAAAQAVEHYEIARYGTLRNWARELGKDDVAQLLEETLAEEEKTDELLTQLADANVNRKGKRKPHDINGSGIVAAPIPEETQLDLLVKTTPALCPAVFV
ncbi:ferritin-like metal-binding protein YciE [Neorhizobium sp. 2083]|nr:ferritin-like metal-binding protein YciE [Neorhizobium sp. 2083]